MRQEIIEHLQKITAEEQEILNGRRTVDTTLYNQNDSMVMDRELLLEKGKLISLRPHTRFLHFPSHNHNYVEVIYMCSGSTVHIINGSRVKLHAGELLFLGQNAVQEVEACSQEDIAVNFCILPEFFDRSLDMIGSQSGLVRDFLIDCLKNNSSQIGYLHYKVADVLPIQNLVENLVLTLMQDTPNKRKTSQMTMALLFLQLMNNTETLVTDTQADAAIFRVLRYAETNYADGSLRELAQLLHYDVCWLSREIKQKTGKTYTQIIQEKRLAQAAFLLRSTDRNVADISAAVGYENVSYFHRIFAATYGKSPKQYRDA